MLSDLQSYLYGLFVRFKHRNLMAYAFRKRTIVSIVIEHFRERIFLTMDHVMKMYYFRIKNMYGDWRVELMYEMKMYLKKQN